MKGRRKDETGVSVVVGVMLMLVITLILAAVVSAFAGGLISIKEKPLQVTVTARTENLEGNNTILFDHTGGDQFSLDEIIIILDQGDQQLRITNATINREMGYNLSRKGGNMYVRPGDTIILKGITHNGYTYFNTTSDRSIAIRHDSRDFSWTLLSQKSDSILSRGTLVFYSS